MQCSIVLTRPLPLTPDYEMFQLRLISMLPWMLPPQQNRAVFLRSVHELAIIVSDRVYSTTDHPFRTHKEPHAGTQSGGSETVERSDWLDVIDWVPWKLLSRDSHFGRLRLQSASQ